MTITIGSWLIPAALTTLFLGGWWAWSAAQPSSGGYGAIGAGLIDAIALLGAIILTLIAWLVWALAS